MPIFLKIRGLKKVYGYRLVINNLDFDIVEKCINVITGDNGVGKSTLLNIISGIDSPDAGQFMLKDRQVGTSKECINNISYLSSKLFLYEDLSIEKNIRFFCGLKTGVIPTQKTIKQFFSILKLESFLEFPIKKLSTGMAKKTALGCVFMQNPKLLLLDEPYSSLDSEACQILTGLLTRFIENDGTVVMTTHQNIPQFPVTISRTRMVKGKMVPTDVR